MVDGIFISTCYVMGVGYGLCKWNIFCALRSVIGALDEGDCCI